MTEKQITSGLSAPQLIEGLFERNAVLENENRQIKQTIKEAYENERTQLGRSVLRHLLEKIE